jgi:hypothetical protein
MSTLASKKYKESFSLIRTVLMEKWDPISISDEEACFDEYDSYIPFIYKELVGKRESATISEYLLKITSINMCFENCLLEDFQSVTDELLKLRL